MNNSGSFKSFPFEIDTNSGDKVKLHHDICHAVKLCCADLIGEGVEDENMKLTTIQGGLTNQLYLIEIDSLKVLVRIYGLNTEVLIDRVKDLEIFGVLSKLDFGPKLYGSFKNGRVEGFIPSKALDPPQLSEKNFALLIASQLSKMHSLQLELEKKPQLWVFLEKFEKLASEVSFPSDEDSQNKLQSFKLDDLRKRLRLLETEIPSPKNEYGAKLVEENMSAPEKMCMEWLFESVFCHNDLLAQNVLYVKDGNYVKFIDFEYSAYNFRGFDLANHFCEYAGFDFDLKRWYPDEQGQALFVLQYLQASEDEKSKDILKEIEKDQEFKTDFLKASYKWINRFAYGSHYLWGLWAIIQKVYSPIDFDYLDYARLRLQAIDTESKF